jgi:hypothetical protein
MSEYKKDSNSFIIKTTPGDQIENTNNQYSTNIIFYNNSCLKDRKYIVKQYPDINNISNNMIIEVNFEEITIHLLIQRIINNYHYPTGIIFILVGIFLCFFGFYQKIVKLIVSIVLGELITFFVFVIVIGINIKWFEFLFIFIGIIIGIIIGYFSILHTNFYKVIIGLTSGIIFGILLIDIIFIFLEPVLIFPILVDSLLISSISFLIIIKVLNKYYIFLNSIIGGYILIRGLSLLLINFIRYQELQIIIYFMDKNERDYFRNDNAELHFKLFWIYDILILCCIIISISFYYYHTNYYTKNISETESEIEEENEEKHNLKMKSLSSQY